MASSRALNLTSRWRSIASSLAPHALRATATRPVSTSHTKNQEPRLYFLTGLERAVQELYGDEWKQHLNKDQRRFIALKERSRRRWLDINGQPGHRPAREDEYPPEHREKVDRLKAELIEHKQVAEAEKWWASQAEQAKQNAASGA